MGQHGGVSTQSIVIRKRKKVSPFGILDTLRGVICMGQHGGVSTQSIVIYKKNIGCDPIHSEHPVRPNYAQLISSKVTNNYRQETFQIIRFRSITWKPSATNNYWLFSKFQSACKSVETQPSKLYMDLLAASACFDITRNVDGFGHAGLDVTALVAALKSVVNGVLSE